MNAPGPDLAGDRTAAAGTTAAGYLHEVGFYRSDGEFRDLICPFALGGLEAGEPVVFAYDAYKMELLQRWLPETPGISYVTDTGPYGTPAKALLGWRKVIQGQLAGGAPRVRIAGNVPHPGYGRPYSGWDRYEAAIDRALGDLPVWAPCLYDVRIAPPEVLATAKRRHHHVLDCTGSHRANDSFEPARHLADFLPPPADPLMGGPPALELVDQTPARVRAAVRDLAAGVVASDQCADLVLAASEVAANASQHGRPPVRVRLWTGAERVVVEVRDDGAGPEDPLAGLLPSEVADGASGRGLWLAHQLDLEIALVAGAGFSVRIGVGSESAPRLPG